MPTLGGNDGLPVVAAVVVDFRFPHGIAGVADCQLPKLACSHDVLSIWGPEATIGYYPDVGVGQAVGEGGQ